MGECDWDLVWLIVLNYYIYVVCFIIYIDNEMIWFICKYINNILGVI